MSPAALFCRSVWILLKAYACSSAPSAEIKRYRDANRSYRGWGGALRVTCAYKYYTTSFFFSSASWKKLLPAGCRLHLCSLKLAYMFFLQTKWAVMLAEHTCNAQYFIHKCKYANSKTRFLCFPLNMFYIAIIISFWHLPFAYSVEYQCLYVQYLLIKFKKYL